MSSGLHGYYKEYKGRRKTVKGVLKKLYEETGSYYGVAKATRQLDPTGNGVSVTHIKRILKGRIYNYRKKTRKKVYKVVNPWSKY